MFVDELFCSWIRARQKAKVDAAATARRLWTWMETDQYGFSSGLERSAAEALDSAGLTAFEALIRAKAPKDALSTVQTLKSIYARQGDIDRYLELCPKAPSPRDCEVCAEVLLRQGSAKEALSWVERGLKQGRQERVDTAWGLDDLKRKLLRLLGRGAEALAAAWREFEESPSSFRYETLMKEAPEAERARWHDRAMKTAEKAELHDAVELFVAAKDLIRLAARVRCATAEELREESHYVMDRAVDALAKGHPDLAARIYVAMAERILVAKKSKYYHAALGNLEKAGECHRRCGTGDAWMRLLESLRATHARKYRFISGLAHLLSGKRVPRQASFLDRARRRVGKISKAAGEEE